MSTSARATGFASALPGSGADVVQVLHHDYGANRRRIDDSPTDHMVAVAAEAVDLPGQAAQTPLGRASSFYPFIFLSRADLTASVAFTCDAITS